MDEMRVNMVKFLMTMFETSSDSVASVRMFKSNVEELVRRNQIPNSVKNLIYNMYGIANTDTFKPNAQNNKLMQINMLMMQLDNIIKSGNRLNIETFKQNIENGVRAGSILKSARDIVFDIYGLESYKSNSSPTTQVKSSYVGGKINTTRPQNLGSVIDTVPTKKSKSVLEDIAQFKSQYVPEIYYEYPNPNYDGCSGSSRMVHKKLIDSLDRPVGATFVIYNMIADDGCHKTYRYEPVPSEYYRPTTRSSTKINTPTTSSAVGCTGGISINRSC